MLSVSELPLNNGINNGITNGICGVVDVSGSMAVDAKQALTKSGEANSITRIELLKHALNTILTLNDNDNNNVPFGIYPFTEDVVVKPLKLQDNSITEIENYIKTLTPLDRTKLLIVLKNAITDALKVGLKQVFIITDGMLDDCVEVIEYLLGLHITNPDFKVHFIALGADVPTEIAYLASLTEATYYIIYDVGRTDVVMIDLLTNMGTRFAFAPDNANDNNNNNIRLSFIEMLNNLIKCLDTNNKNLIGAKKILSDYETILRSSDLNIPECVLNELKHEGQLDIIATRHDAYRNWGKHHIMWLISALTNMNITISIDSSPILKLFETEKRTQLMKMFEERILNNPQFAVKLEQGVSDGRARAVPCPYARYASIASTVPASTVPASTVPASTVPAYSAYYNIGGGGCFVSNMPVEKVNPLTGEIIQTTAGEIKKGDIVVVGYDANGNPITSCILCVIIVYYTGDLFNGLTPYHPIRLIDKNGNITYIFAKDMENAVVISVVNEPVYDFLFDSKAKLGYFTSTLNGVQVQILTLGHGITEGIANHQYFTNYEKNLTAAEKHLGFKDGLIVSENTQYVRDPTTREITEIIY